MKVLVLGATGFIGLPTALALSRAGHIVYGTTRDPKAAHKLLRQNEIIPLMTTIATERGDAAWSKVAAECDVVIDTRRSMDADEPLKSFRLVESIPTRGGPASRITYIYTGSLHGHSRGVGGLDAWTSEQQPLAGAGAGPNEPSEHQWRWDVEAEILASERVNGIVVRPGVLYGRSGAQLEPYLFAPAHDAARRGAEFDTVGLPSMRFAMIHQDDLAELFVLIAERGPILRGTAMVAANPATERWVDILDAVVRVSGAKGYRLNPPAGDMTEPGTPEFTPSNSSPGGTPPIRKRKCSLLSLEATKRPCDDHAHSSTTPTVSEAGEGGLETSTAVGGGQRVIPVELPWASTTQIRPTLATSLTGWTPRKPGLVDGIDMYWDSFVAHYEGRKTITAWELPGVQRPRT